MVTHQKSSSSRDRIERKWINAVESNQIKSSSKDYKKIVAKRKVGTKVASKKNMTEQMEQEDSANSQLKKEALKSKQPNGHRKSPTHAQIHRLPLDQQSAKLMQMKSIGSLCSNPSSGSNMEQIAEETKQEHSQALTYQSGGFMKEGAPEDYSLNTWNSPTKGATTTSAS